MKKQFLAILLVVVMLVAALPLYVLPVSAADTYIAKDYSDVVQAQDTSGAAAIAGPATSVASASSRVKMTVSKATDPDSGKSISRATITRASGSNKLVGLCFSFPEGAVATDDAKYVTIQYKYTHAASTTASWTGIAGSKMALQFVLSDGSTKIVASNEIVVEGEWSTVTFDFSSVTGGLTISRVRLYFLGNSNTTTTIYTDKYTMSSGSTVDVGTVYYSTTGYYTGETEEPEVTKYNVTAVADGVTVDTAEVEEGANYTLPAAPVKDGYDFVGWSDGTNTYAAGAEVAITKATTFTAVYELSAGAVFHQVTVKVDDETVATDSIIDGETYTLPAAPVKDGYNFMGWSDGKNTYSAGAEVAINAETTFTAVFVEKAVYTVTVVSDGTTMATDSIVDGTTYTLPAAPVKDGYKFAGWSDGTTTHEAGANVAIVGNTTFTAVFVEKAPIVQAGNFIVKNYADNALITDTWKGYTPTTAINNDVDKSAPVKASIAQTTVFTRDVSKLTFNAVSGNKGTGISFYLPDGETSTAQAKYVSVQYRYTNKDATVNTIGSKMTLRVTLENGAIYYIRSANSMVAGEWATMTFDLSSIAEIDTIETFHLYPYVFGGNGNYGQTADGTTKKQVNYVVGDTVELGSFFFSSDENNQYKTTTTLNFYSDSSKEELVDSLSSVLGVFVIPTAEVKEDYTFEGWMDDDGNSYAEGETVYTYLDVEIYANYRPDSVAENEFRVSFNFAGGEAEAIEPFYASEVVMPAGPRKLGYTFTGWTDGTNTYNVGDTVTITKDTVFTATYTETYYTVTIVSDGVTIVEESVREGATYKLPAPAVKEGYTFVAWFDGIENYASGAAVTIVGNTTFEAVFAEGDEEREVNAETSREYYYSYKNPMTISDSTFSSGSGSVLKFNGFSSSMVSSFADADGKQGVTLSKNDASGSIMFNVTAAYTYPKQSYVSFDVYFNELPTYEDGKIGIFTDRGQHKSGLEYTVDSSWLRVWTDENGKSWMGMSKCDTPVEVKKDTWYSAVFYIPGITANTKTESFQGWVKSETDDTYRAIGSFTNCSMVGETNRQLFAFYNNPYANYSVSNFAMSVKADDSFIKVDGCQFSKISNGVYSVRFVTAIGGLVTGQTKIGFDVSCESQGKEWNLETNKVYKSILANYGLDKITADNVGGEYITTLTIHNIPASIGEIELVCTPYVIINNQKYYGSTVTIDCIPDSGNWSFGVIEASGETSLPVTVVGGSVNMSITKDGVTETHILEKGFHEMLLSSDTEATSHIYEIKISGAGWCNYEELKTNGSIVDKDSMYIQLNASNGTYKSFAVYVRTSDPSGKYYIKYNFDRQISNDNCEEDGADAVNRDLYRINGASLVRVNNYANNGEVFNVTTLNEVLHNGELSLAIKEVYSSEPMWLDKDKTIPKMMNIYDENGNKIGETQMYETKDADDYIGGYHGDERIDYDYNGEDGEWPISLYVDGKEIALNEVESATVIPCTYITFNQITNLYSYGSSTADSYGKEVARHTQTFTISTGDNLYGVGGIRNEQTIEWLTDFWASSSDSFLQMFTMMRREGEWRKDANGDYVDDASGNHIYDMTDWICDTFSVYNEEGLIGTSVTNYPVGEQEQHFVRKDNLYVKYSCSEENNSGITAYAGYVLPEDENGDPYLKITNSYVYARSDYGKGDNKFYLAVNTADGTKPVEGTVWKITNHYGIDYMTPAK